jgi:hypothetical protein
MRTSNTADKVVTIPGSQQRHSESFERELEGTHAPGD